MSAQGENNGATGLLGQALLDAIRQAVREELRALPRTSPVGELLSPEDLAARLCVPLSWVYEQSRFQEIPSIKVGRYLRFDFDEVLKSPKVQKILIKKKDSPTDFKTPNSKPNHRSA